MSKQGTTGIMRWLKSFMLKHLYGMITCGQFEEFVQAYHDGELPDAQKRVFEWHLRICQECREYLAAYQRTIELGRIAFEVSDETVPVEVPEGLVKAILDARRQ
ncbi:MAG: anti-sigma factor RsiW [Halieaceae bacterium]|jgi:anti-sigma factor RsiW